MVDEYTGDPKLKAVWKLGKLVHANISQVEAGTEGATSVGLFEIIQTKDSKLTAEKLVKAIKAAHKGHYQDETVERLLLGPSYIELGAWIGDQGLALCLMGLGEILGLWTVVTPRSLNITDEAAIQSMMVSGFIMIAPTENSLLKS